MQTIKLPRIGQLASQAALVATFGTSCAHPDQDMPIDEDDNTSEPSDDVSLELDDENDLGLGQYGKTGPIKRHMFPERQRTNVSEEAIGLAQSVALATARKNWHEKKMDFVFHIQAQLHFRAQTDYLATDADHLGRVLALK